MESFRIWAYQNISFSIRRQKVGGGTPSWRVARSQYCKFRNFQFENFQNNIFIFFQNRNFKNEHYIFVLESDKLVKYLKDYKRLPYIEIFQYNEFYLNIID